MNPVQKIKVFLLSLMSLGMAQESSGNMMSLPDFVSMTLEKHASIQLIRLDSIKSESTRKTALGKILPSLGVYASHRYVENSPSATSNGEQTEWGVQLNWTLFDGFKMFAAHSLVKGLIKEGEWKRKQNTWDLVLASLSELNALEHLLEKEKIQKLEVSRWKLLHEKQLDSFERIGQKIELDRIKAEYLRAEVELLSVRNERFEKQADLNVYLGKEIHDTSWVVSWPKWTEPKDSIDEWLAAIDEKNWHSLELKSRMENKTLETAIEKSKYWPVLSFSSSVAQVVRERNLDVIGSRVQAGLQLNWNIWNGFQDQVSLKIAEVNQRKFKIENLL